ncbi:hypothetical protein [Pseudomonas fluorescens]|nr:hypothetical protein [Pseudomonas fluorescens]
MSDTSNALTVMGTQGMKEVLKSYLDIHMVEKQSAEWQCSV